MRRSRSSSLTDMKTLPASPPSVVGQRKVGMDLVIEFQTYLLHRIRNHHYAIVNSIAGPKRQNLLSALAPRTSRFGVAMLCSISSLCAAASLLTVLSLASIATSSSHTIEM